MKDYIVATSVDLVELIQEVNKNLEKGFIPLGGIVQAQVLYVDSKVKLDNRPRQAAIFCQAMAMPKGMLEKFTN